jgi:hypothetical protein
MDYGLGKVRDIKVTPTTGKDIRDTNVLSGLTEKSPTANVKNDTNEYETGVTDKGALGGWNKNN